MRYGGILCLNRDMKKLAEHILLFEPMVIRMVPMMAKALYNRIAILNRQHPEMPIRKVKEQVLGTRLHKIISGAGSGSQLPAPRYCYCPGLRHVGVFAENFFPGLDKTG